MYIPMNSAVTFTDVEGVTKMDQMQCLMLSKNSAAIHKRLSRDTLNFLMTLEKVYAGMEDFEGTLSFKFGKNPDYAFYIEESFDDGRDWANDEVREEFNKALVDGDSLKMKVLRMMRSVEKKGNE